MYVCSSLHVCTMWVDSEYRSDHEKSAEISNTNKNFLEDELLENVPGGNGASSEVRSDLLNDARWLFQSKGISFDSYAEHKIIYESSPIMQGGFFHSFIPYDKNGNILSPIAKLEGNTPREQSSDGLWMKGMG